MTAALAGFGESCRKPNPKGIRGWQKHSHTTNAQHDTYTDVHHLIPDDFLSFGFVRNPFERLVSAWESTRGIYSKSFKEFCVAVTKKDTSNLPPNGLRKLLLIPMKSFLYYHDRPVGFIGRFENLHEDWKTIMSMTGLSGHHLPHRNCSSKRTGLPPIYQGYHKYYDNHSLEIISAFYEDDLCTFNYSFNNTDHE